MTVQQTAKSMARVDLRQWIKLAVYSLLVVNFFVYLSDDVRISAHTLPNNASVLDHTAAFAVTLDTFAWLTLLFLFELETYLLSDEALTRGRLAAIHGIRLLCFAFLAHTLFAYAKAGFDLTGLTPIADTSELCQLADRELSFGSNLTYTELNESNCQSLSTDTRFYLIEEGTVVTDTTGLTIERELVWLDLAESLAWLIILLCIETVVRLQNRGITRGTVIRSASVIKLLLYAMLWGAAVYWVYRGHYIYAWDEALWILGFFAIEMNISEWKTEIRDADDGGRETA